MLEYNITDSLVGKLLISLPVNTDTRFIKSVIFVVSHNKSGATGIVINKPSVHKFASIIKSIDNSLEGADIAKRDKDVNIVLGGPINSNNLFVIHSSEYKIKDTISITKDISMTNQPEAMLDIAKNNGAKSALIAIGCANWIEGQLEKEILSDVWLVTDCSADIIFNVEVSTLYAVLYERMNVGIYNPAFFMGAKDV